MRSQAVGCWPSGAGAVGDKRRNKSGEGYCATSAHTVSAPALGIFTFARYAWCVALKTITGVERIRLGTACTFLILFSTLAVAQSPRTHQDAYALPNAPSASQPNTLPLTVRPNWAKPDFPCPKGYVLRLGWRMIPEDRYNRNSECVHAIGEFSRTELDWPSSEPERPDVITVDDIKEQGFWRGHPTRTKLIIAAIGGGVGLTIALVTRHNCPKYINGYRYDGTPPCPGKDYDPGGKSVGLRWRF